MVVCSSVVQETGDRIPPQTFALVIYWGSSIAVGGFSKIGSHAWWTWHFPSTRRLDIVTVLYLNIICIRPCDRFLHVRYMNQTRRHRWLPGLVSIALHSPLARHWTAEQMIPCCSRSKIQTGIASRLWGTRMNVWRGAQSLAFSYRAYCEHHIEHPVPHKYVWSSHGTSCFDMEAVWICFAVPLVFYSHCSISKARSNYCGSIYWQMFVGLWQKVFEQAPSRHQRALTVAIAASMGLQYIWLGSEWASFFPLKEESSLGYMGPSPIDQLSPARIVIHMYSMTLYWPALPSLYCFHVLQLSCNNMASSLCCNCHGILCTTQLKSHVCYSSTDTSEMMSMCYSG